MKKVAKLIKEKDKMRMILTVFLLVGLLVGCTKPQFQKVAPGAYIPCSTTLFLYQGATTKTHVLDVLGAPDIVTKKGNGITEWLYKQSNVARETSKENRTTVVLLKSHGCRPSYQQPSHNMILIMDFNRRGVLSSYKSVDLNY